LALWIGLCLYLSLLDRSPRAYLFMLAGYTAGIIGFPSVAAPGGIFETALTRVEEISIGIACTTLFGTILFPRPLGPVLASRIASWIKPAVAWAVAALAGKEEDAETKAARRNLAAEAVDISMMTSQLAYDTSHLQGAVQHVTRLRQYILSLMPVVSSISDRVAQLRALDGITLPLQSLLDDCTVWLRDGYDAPPSVPDALEAQITVLERASETGLSWEGILRTTLLVRLHELVTMVRHARSIRHHLMDDAAAPPREDLEILAAPDKVRDHGLALLSALAAGLAVLLVCSFWIFTGWSYGAGAAVIVAVACSFFAAMDDPAPAILLMTRNAVIVVIVDAIYIFLILPRVETFAELMLVLLPAGLVIGVLVSRPATFGTGMVMGAVGSTNLGLGNGYQGNFVAYANGAVALLAGLLAALVITQLIRSVGAAWSAKRLLRAGWRDVAAAATARGHHDRAHLTGIMLDRLGLLMPRMAAVSPGADLACADVLQDLRVGLSALGLQRGMPFFSPAGQVLVARVLDGVAAHYLGNPLRPADPALLEDIDAALTGIARHVSTAHGRHHREALLYIVGLRRGIFGDAPAPFIEMQAAA
jgi:uncharacterized membrane protein YccC